MPTVQSIKAGMAVKASVAKAAQVAKNVVAKSTAKVAEGNKGAEALANQNKILVKQPYVRPSVEVIKMEDPKSLRAASGAGENPWPGRGGFDSTSDEASSIWG